MSSNTLTLRDKNRLTLPKQLIPEGVDRFEYALDEEGRIILTPLTEIPLNQRYFWTRRWQEGEQKANEDAKKGRYKRKTVRQFMKEIE